jgi:hypothetical protein
MSLRLLAILVRLSLGLLLFYASLSLVVALTQLANAKRAKAFALTLRAERGFTLPNVPICLGRMESSDFAPLSQQRKDAVQAFWTAYLTEKDRSPELHFDGTGMLTGIDGCFSGLQQATTN